MTVVPVASRELSRPKHSARRTEKPRRFWAFGGSFSSSWCGFSQNIYRSSLTSAHVSQYLHSKVSDGSDTFIPILVVTFSARKSLTHGDDRTNLTTAFSLVVKPKNWPKNRLPKIVARSFGARFYANPIGSPRALCLFLNRDASSREEAGATSEIFLRRRPRPCSALRAARGTRRARS